MSLERYGTKTDAVVKLVLVFFVALLSFSIGTFVGKKFSDNQHKMAQMEPGGEENTEAVKEGEHGDTAAAKEESEHKEGDKAEEASAEHGAANESHGDRNVASVSEEAHSVKPEKALSDEEISKLAEEFVVDDKKPAAKHEERSVASEGKKEEKAEHGKEAKAEEKTTHESEKSHGEEKAAHGKEKSEHGKEAKKEEHSATANGSAQIPQALPKEMAAANIGKYTVQVGSYPSEQEAQKKAAELKEKGFSAFYVTAKIKNTTWYRVNVGLFTTQKEADAYKKELATKAQISSAFTQKISNIE